MCCAGVIYAIVVNLKPTMMNQTSKCNANLSKNKERDTEEVACFLLSLKHNSDRSATVSPDPEQNQVEVIQTSNHKPPQFSFASLSDSSIGSKPYASSNFDDLIIDSNLVYPKDRDLVPDALFVAMAQMNPCTLTHADRVGCYKAREIGFVGMSCKFCGGQPGFGRFFPASIRSLAQTTTSQTIMKHIAGKCRFCPPQVRNTVLDLQREQALRESMSSGRPRYGSRKIFFQRVWARLHDVKDAIDEDNKTIATADESASNSTPSGTDDISLSSISFGEEDGGISAGLLRQKRPRFGMLPTQENKRAKYGEEASLQRL